MPSQSAFYKIPHLQIRSDGVLYYEHSEHKRVARIEFFGDAKTYSGAVTNPGQRRIKKAVDMLLQRSPTRRIFNPVIQKTHDFSVGFLTLTIPARREVKASWGNKNLLEPFLRTARRKWGMTDYLWKAELQERGQLHYHITLNRFIEFTRVRSEWNKLLKRYNLSLEYARKHGNFNPNSVDIHAVHQVKNMKAYLAKYIAKTEGRGRLDSKVWDCSKELKRKQFAVQFHWAHEKRLLDGLQQGLVEKYECEHAIFLKMQNPVSVLSDKEQAAYRQYIFL